jgi:hypothetical protein
MSLYHIFRTVLLILLFDLHHNAFGDRLFGADVTRVLHLIVMHAIKISEMLEAKMF